MPKNYSKEEMEAQAQNRGWLKIAVGLILMIGSVAGWIFGRTAKSRVLRSAILILSAGSFGAGLYLFVGGIEDIGIGLIGQYKLDGPAQQTLTYPGPNFFKMSLGLTKAGNPTLRRLKFECPDGSESFTVYLTKIGTFGIPSKGITCKDGFQLLAYDPSKGFVVEVHK